MAHFPSLKAHGDSDLVAFTEESVSVPEFRLKIMRVNAVGKLDFFKLDDLDRKSVV